MFGGESPLGKRVFGEGAEDDTRGRVWSLLRGYALLLRTQQIPRDPAFLASGVAAPVPAVDLAERFERVAAADRENGRVEGFCDSEPSVAERGENFLWHIAVAAGGSGCPNPAGPSAVGGSSGDFVARLEGQRVGVFFLVVGVGSEDGHGWNADLNGDQALGDQKSLE